MVVPPGLVKITIRLCSTIRSSLGDFRKSYIFYLPKGRPDGTLKSYNLNFYQMVVPMELLKINQFILPKGRPDGT